MRTVVTSSLNGTAYQLEEAGYDALRRYLDEAETKLRADPDCAEILADLEQVIGEKCASCLDAHRNVVGTEDVQRILAQMGPVEGGNGAPTSGAYGTTGATGGSTGAGGGTSGAGATPTGSAAGHAPRRLYQLSEGALISGVCNGLAAYLGIDVIVVRDLRGPRAADRGHLDPGVPGADVRHSLREHLRGSCRRAWIALHGAATGAAGQAPVRAV
jgi:hypothetical protein